MRDKPDRYAAPVIKALRAGDPDAVARAIRFLHLRLTDAAKAGCHHCDEGARGTPCWWCGLKNETSVDAR